MDVRDTRARNLRALIKQHGRSHLAGLAGTSPAYLTQAVSMRTKAAGHDLARRIERGLALEDGWLDRDHDNYEHDLAVWLSQLSDIAVAALLAVLSATAPDLEPKIGDALDHLRKPDNRYGKS